MGILHRLFEKATSAPDPEVNVLSPAEGNAVPLSEFPDALFSQGILGPGCGILPAGDLVAAPFDGTVTQSIDTGHAIGLTGPGGVELLIHIGVDTVEMGGQGFQPLVSQGQKVKAGTPLIRFDRSAILAAGHPDAIAVVVTNGDDFSTVELTAAGSVSVGQPLLLVKR